MIPDSATANGPVVAPKIENPKFFRIIEEHNIIDRDFINDLLAEFDSNALDVLATLIQSGIASKRRLCQYWCDSIGIAHVDLEKTLFQQDLVRRVPERIARQYYAIPVYQMGSTITVATATPDNEDIRKILEDVTGGPVSLVFALPQDIETSIEKEYAGSFSVYDFFSKLSAARLLRSQKEITARNLVHTGGRDAINQLHVAVILYGVIRAASEIRITGGSGGGRIAYGIPNGRNFHIPVEAALLDKMAERLELLAGIQRKTETQDSPEARHGHIRLPTPGKKIDVKIESRAGTPRTILLKLTGAKPFRKAPDIDNLFLSNRIHRHLSAILTKSKGHIVAAGPAKNGKSTLAYAMMQERAARFKNSMAIENTVKFFLPGVNQYQVNHSADITATGLLDSENGKNSGTTYIQNIEGEPGLPGAAARAVLGGRFIISGIAANTAAAAFEKLMDLGAASTVTAIVCQQLVGRLCDACKVRYTLRENHVDMLFETEETSRKTVHAWHEKGCPYCNHSGFSGLIGIHDLLVIDNHQKKLIIDGAGAADVLTAARPENICTMHYDGVKKVLRGLTTFDELSRLPVS